ncbi:MAG: IS3 family transposase [Clostridiales bacterium]|nr:IS3 family transposase [Clostridiales bacterium]
MTGSKKNLPKSLEKDGKRKLVSKSERLSVVQQCKILGLNRSSVYYTPKQPLPEKLEREEYIQGRIDCWHTKYCYMGVRKLRNKLQEDDGIKVGRKLIRRLMNDMGLHAIYPKSNLSKRNKAHKVFPYLLRNLPITKPNQVWAIDITYIPMGKTHMYLTAIIDWYSRFVVGYELSDSLDTTPVITALKRAIELYGKPEIINSDQGSQFTSSEYTLFLNNSNIRQSMDGKARWVDNVIIEHWFRSLKCDHIYINEYNSPKELRKGISRYVLEYNKHRPHQSLQYKRPIQVFLGTSSAA